MIGEIKYCKFCNKEKPIEEFAKSGFAIKNICRECQNKKQAQIYRDSKKVKELENQQKEFIEWLEDKLAILNNIVATDEYEDNRHHVLIRRTAFEEALSKYKEIIGVKDES